MFDFLALEKRQHLTPVKLELFRGREWGGGGTERNREEFRGEFTKMTKRNSTRSCSHLLRDESMKCGGNKVKEK